MFKIPIYTGYSVVDKQNNTHNCDSNGMVKVVQKDKETNCNISRVIRNECSYNDGLSCPHKMEIPLGSPILE